jgi:phage protein D
VAMAQAFPEIYAPGFEVRVDGSPLPDRIAGAIMDVSVTLHATPPGQFSFRVSDPRLEFINRERGELTEGKRVQIRMGYAGRIEELIDGEISALAPDFPEGGPATLQVQGFDLLHRLTRGTAYRSWGAEPGLGMPDSQVAAEIALEAGLLPAVQPTAVRTEPTVQSRETNLAFVERLARRNGFSLWVEGEVLHFRKQFRSGFIPTLPVILEWGKTLQSFSPRLSTAGQVEAVELRGWDPIQKQSFAGRVERSGTAKSDLASSGQLQISRGAAGRSELSGSSGAASATALEAKSEAEGVLAEQRGSMVTGSGTCVGDPRIRAGVEVVLKGLGRFGGTYVVEQATHTYGAGGYQTSFEVGAP